MSGFTYSYWKPLLLLAENLLQTYHLHLNQNAKILELLAVLLCIYIVLVTTSTLEVGNFDEFMIINFFSCFPFYGSSYQHEFINPKDYFFVRICIQQANMDLVSILSNAENCRSISSYEIRRPSRVTLRTRGTCDNWENSIITELGSFRVFNE